MDVAAILEKSGLKELNPVQQLAVAEGFDQSLVVAAPTASGKTLIAEIAALHMIAKGKKVVYIVPLRALANEKYDDFKRKYEPAIKVGISTGDLDATDQWLAKFDIIIVTAEKMDSLLRHGIVWAAQIGLVVADEIHLLHDPDRGPTLEIVLTRLRAWKPVILGLSATIQNYQELADWLGARVVRSNYRPVTLYKGVCFDGVAQFMPQRSYPVEGEPLETLTAKGQSLLFLSTRRSTEAVAERLARTVKERLTPQEKTALADVASAVLGAIDHPTPQCERLARCVREGTAFHHAGLLHAQRQAIEQSFKRGEVKTMCATPTLAAGLNLPAYRVIIRDLKRFSTYRGMDYLPALETAQMMGRAGRPAYDTEGEAILLPKSKAEAEYSWETYIMGETEKITSKLGVEPVLRTHVLALIAGDVCRSRKELLEFFARTFYVHQYQDMGQIARHLDRITQMLEKWGFISMTNNHGGDFQQAYYWQEEDANYKATSIGKRVSELYLDPLTANTLVLRMKTMVQPTFFTVAHLVAGCLELKRSASIRKGDEKKLQLALAENEPFLAERPPNEWDLEYENFLRGLKMALLLQAWAEELGEDKIMEEWNVAPGELRARLDIADWLLYGSHELALLLGNMQLLKDVRRARLRVQYGIREELLPLVKLKGVGRVRARKLFNSGFKRLADLRKAPQESLERVVGKATAAGIKDQLGQLQDEED